MALITDPDYLKQGNTVSFPVSATTTRLKVIGANPNTATMTYTSGPAFQQYDYFEIRTANTTGASNIANNVGLYQITAVASPTSYTVKKVAGSQGSLANTTVGGDTTIKILGSNTIAGAVKTGSQVLTATAKSVYYDTFNKKIWLIRQGNLDDDGVTLQTIYSFTKEQWKYDPYLIQFDFPFTAITPEQFEIGSGTAAGWRFYDLPIPIDNEYNYTAGSLVALDSRYSRELIRTGGWSEFDATGQLQEQYAGVISLGTFDNTNDLAYYQQGNDPTDTAARENFTFTDAVNEGVLTFKYYANTATTGGHYGPVNYPHSNTIARTTGSWITDGYQVGGKIEVVSSEVSQPIGTYTIETITTTNLEVTTDPFIANTATDTDFSAAWDNRNVLNIFLRANSTIAQSKSYGKVTLGDIGVTNLANQVYRFPLTNSPDVKITGAGAPFETDGDITQAPWDGDSRDVINIKYFDVPFKVRIDSASSAFPREYGIVVDAGTFSGVKGSATGGTATFNAGVTIPGGFEGGKLSIYNGQNANVYVDTSTTPSDSKKYTVASISGSTINLTSNLGGSGGETGLSFSLERSSANNTANSIPIVAGNPKEGTTIENVYAAIQYQLRQDANINKVPSGNTVTGSTADELLSFTGDVITAGSAVAGNITNPEGGGSGVFIVGYQTSDVNDIRAVDNAGTERRFPLSVLVTLTFNDNLIADAATNDAKYWMFYDRTVRRTATTISTSGVSGRNITIADSGSGFTLEAGDDYNVGEYLRVSGFTNPENNGIYRITGNGSAPANLQVVKVDGLPPVNESAGATVNVDQQPIDTPSALLVQDDSNTDVTGNIPNASPSEVTFNYAYDTNAQGARDAGDGNADVVVRAIGFDSGQFVEVAATITNQATPISVVAGLERNYSNPV